MPPMSKEHKRILRRNEDFLKTDMSIRKRLIGILFSEEHIDRAERGDIQGKVTDDKKVEALLEILSKKEDGTFQGFIDALIEDEQKHVADRLMEGQGANLHGSDAADAANSANPAGTDTENERSKQQQKKVLASQEKETMKQSYITFLRGNRANMTAKFLLTAGNLFLDRLTQYGAITAGQQAQINVAGALPAIKSGCLLNILEKRLGTHFQKFCVLLWSDGDEVAAAQFLKKLNPDDQKEIFGKLAPWPELDLDQ